MAETNETLPRTNEKLSHTLEALAQFWLWDKGSDQLVEELVRCKDCKHHLPCSDAVRRKEWTYCKVYDTLKRYEGFCELGVLEEENG